MDKLNLNVNALNRDTSSSKYRLENYDSRQRASPSPNSHRLSYKENLNNADYSPSFRCKDYTPEPVKRQDDIHNRLQEIRKKYESQLGSILGHQRNVSPLKELDNLSPVPRLSELKISESKPTIQRTFSFINVEPTQSKPQTNRFQEQSIVEPNLNFSKGFVAWRNPCQEPQNVARVSPHKSFYEDFKTYEGRSKDKQTLQNRSLYNNGNFQQSNDNFYEREARVQRSFSQSKPPLAKIKEVDSYARASPSPINGEKVQSIDRINVRIKEILQSIKDNDNEGYYMDSVRKNYAGKYDRPSESKQSKSPRYTNTKSEVKGNASLIHTRSLNVEMDSYGNQNKQLIHQSKAQLYSCKPKQTKPISLSIKYVQKRNNLSEYKPKENQPQEVIERPHTFRTPPSERKNAEYTSKSGHKPQTRDLDVEIQRIQERIKKSEQEKRKLWINEVDNKSKYRQHQNQIALSGDIKKNSVIKNPGDAWGNEIAQKQTTKYPNIQQYNAVKSPQPSRKVSQQPSVRDFTNMTYESQSFALQREYQPQAYKPSSHYQSKASNILQQRYEQKKQNKFQSGSYGTRNSLIPKAEELSIKIMPVQYEPDSQIKLGKQTKKLIECLKHQVSLDEELRNAKIWLDSADIFEKWEKLETILQQCGVRMNKKTIEEQFANTLEEHNPFFTIKNYNQTLESVVQKYLKAKDYWESHIIHKFDSEQLKRENFNSNKLDLQRKGFLSVEDLVRFLNIETGTFYRNRDLVLVFRRLTKNEKMDFSELINKVGSSR